MTYPSEKIHRVSRRRLPRGQHATPEPITANVMGSGHVVTLAFSAPVQIKGPIGFSQPTNTLISQTVISALRVDLLYTGLVFNLPWIFAPTPATISAKTGAPVIGATGEFMLNPNDVLASAGGNYYPPATTDVKSGVHFGISNTGSVGSYALPTLVQVTSVVDTMDGNYTVTFSQTIVSLVSGTDAGMTMYNPVSHLWESVYCIMQIDAVTIQVSPASAIPGFTLFTVAAQPSQILANAPFAAAPLVAIT